MWALLEFQLEENNKTKRDPQVVSQRTRKRSRKAHGRALLTFSPFTLAKSKQPRLSNEIVKKAAEMNFPPLREPA